MRQLQAARFGAPRDVLTAGGHRKTSMCIAQGAVAAIDYQADDLVRTVDELTESRGADVAIDQRGGDLPPFTWNASPSKGASCRSAPRPVDPMKLAANVSVIGLSWDSHTAPAHRGGPCRVPGTVCHARFAGASP